MINSVLLEQWRNGYTLHLDAITFKNGDIILLEYFELLDPNNYSIKQKHISPLVRTTFESILEFNNDPWVPFAQYIGESNQLICGEGTMGNEGFVACIDDNKDFEWVFFSTRSNPFLKVFYDDKHIVALSEYHDYWIFSKDHPEKIDIKNSYK
ncbi:MAG: hypothetical protein WBP45_01285 [Daejeonella sp.]